MCLDRHLVIYPVVYANDTAFEVQDKVVNEFESKSSPVRMSKYFFRLSLHDLVSC